VAPAALVWRLGALAVAVLVCRLIALGSDQLGLCAGVAVALGVPGLALANIAGIRARVSTPELLALVPITGLAVWIPPFVLALVVHAPFRPVLLLVVVGSALTLSWDPRPMVVNVPWEPIGVLTGGLLFALVSTRYVPSLGGDALFHAGLIRKMLALPGLSLSDVSPYWHGHPHAGYVVPLLHAVEAGAISITGGDPSLAYQNLTPAFGFLVPLAAYGAARSMASMPVAIAAGVFACWDAMSRIAVLGLVKQPPYFTFLVIFPATIVLLNLLYRNRDRRIWWSWTVIAAAEVAILHPTYSVMLFPLILAAVVLRPRAWPVLAAAIGVTLFVDVWIWAVAIHGGERVTLFPGYPHEWMVLNGHDIATSGLMIVAHRPEVVVGLVAAVVILFRGRSPWHLPAAMVVTTLATIATPGAGLVLRHVIAGGQIARFSKVPPAMLVTAIALGILATWLRGRRLLLWATAAGIAVASVAMEHWGLLWGYGTVTLSRHGEVLHPVVWIFTGPDLFVVIVTLAGLVALAVRALDRDRSVRALGVAPAAAPVLLLLFALMVGPLGQYGWAVRDILRDGSYRTYHSPLANRLTPGLIDYFHDHATTPFPVVMAPFREPPADGISYQLVGRADVYTVALLETHTRATPKDHPHARRLQVLRFYSPTTTERERRAIMRRDNISYVVFSKKTQPAAVLRQLASDPTLVKVYEDPPTVRFTSGQFVLFRRITAR
jgi:hypothetical protein